MSDGGLLVFKENDGVVIRDSRWEWVELDIDEATYVYEKLGELLGKESTQRESEL